jgi:hypothetical protein
VSDKRKLLRQAIPEPFENLPSLRAAVLATKEMVETLSGQRGRVDDMAVTWGDLLRLGLVKKDQFPNV